MAYQYNSTHFPDNPGVYLMKDSHGEIIYVGKAKSLRKRVASYFHDLSSRQNINIEKIRSLVASINEIETISTNNEREAILLENELIKLHQPQYNTRLKDDKSFPYIMITCGEKFPRINIIRGVRFYSEKNLFFGPYIDKGAVASTLKMVRKIFPYCSCESKIPRKKKKPCLYYHLKQCPAPCANQDEDAFREEYLQNMKNIVLFLRGNYKGLMERLEREMEAAKEGLKYEKAAILRDKIIALDKTFKPQSVIFTNHDNVDIIASSKNEDELIILVMEVRDGRLTGKIPFIFDLARQVDHDDEILGNFLIQRYNEKNPQVPAKIILQEQLENLDLVQSIICNATGERVKSIDVPGNDPDYQSLFKLGKKNIMHMLYKRKLNRDIASFDQVEALKEIGEKLNLQATPVTIEAYDISNIQGKYPTGSKVCFKDGKPYKKGYRRYKIQSGDFPDDYKMMAELVSRRAKRINEGRDKVPDLILIDGGKGQLHAALDALEGQGLDSIPIVGLAKQEEEIFMPGEKEPLVLEDESKGLMLLKRIRDESHRFAIKYHKQLRQKGLTSEVDETLIGIDHVGEKRARMLKKEFKTLNKIKRASLEELENILHSKRAAKAVHDHFH